MNPNKIKIQNINHHGLVAAIGKILKIEEKINARIPVQERTENITRGQSVMAMVINGLGFTEHRLYMVQHFYNDLPVERLLGKNVTPELLNDDNLGRTLDAIYEYGVTKLYSEIAFEIALEHKAMGCFANIDTTSISVEGQYDTPGEDIERGGNFTITHGYSKDNRDDLKQLVLSLTTTGPASFPVWMETLSGNSSDKSNLIKTIEAAKKFQDQLKKSESFVWVADSALYNKNKLLCHGHNLLWVSRVPETILMAKNIVQQDGESLQWQKIDDSYSIMPIESLYGGVRQRWILVQSKQALKKETHSLQITIQKKEQTLINSIQKFEQDFFYCERDALKELNQFIASNPLFIIEGQVVPFYGKKGRKGEKIPPDQEQNQVRFSLKISYTKNHAEIKKLENARGRFILATNDFNLERLPDHLILKEYKEQSKTERSFKFLKDPSFFCSEVYLKKPERIQALMFIMCLCLMIHNVGQFHIRKILKDFNLSVPNQVKKKTQNPTLKWIFQCFRNVGLVTIDNGGVEKSIVANVDELRLQIISFFGPAAMEIYGVHQSEKDSFPFKDERFYLC